MWNIPTSFAPTGPIVGPFAMQKRHFSVFSFSNVDILPGKSFKNPNFVNNDYPNIHSTNCYKQLQNSPNHCQKSDTSGTATEKCTVASSTNSSQNISDAEFKKENINKNRKSTVENSPMCYSRKRCKKSRRNHKKKIPNKHSKENSTWRQINDMMEVDLESDTSMNTSDSNIMNSISPKLLNLTDFIVDISDIPNKSAATDDEVYTVISISPPVNNKICHRERQLSVCESEDSFIVFDSGTDEELNFSESDDSTELESEDDDSSSEIDDDFDSSCSVVPSKKVRFANKQDLCEVHPMVQWSFAYRKARKGPWEEYARDRERFNKRIQETEAVLRPIFERQHRENVYRDRFNDSGQ